MLWCYMTKDMLTTEILFLRVNAITYNCNVQICEEENVEKITKNIGIFNSKNYKQIDKEITGNK